jgi:hypothetical protein
VSDDKPKSNIIPFAEHAITSADLGEPTDMTKASLEALTTSIDAYGFESEAGPLENCAEWIELKRRLGLPPEFSPGAGR